MFSTPLSFPPPFAALWKMVRCNPRSSNGRPIFTGPLPFLHGDATTPNISWGKTWLEVNFPSRGKVTFFPQGVKVPFSQTLHLLGKQFISRGKGKLFSREIIPRRDNFPSEGNSPIFPFQGNFAPKDVRVESIWNCEVDALLEGLRPQNH